MAVVELTTIRALAEADNVVIACGGGGIPVIATDHHHLKGAAAVIDKDLASELLAEHLDADMLIILTAVEKVAVNFNKPNQKWLDALTPEEARTYIGEGQFAPGSMLPKVEAAVKFAESKPGRTALITLLEKAWTASTVKPAPVSPAELPRPPQPNTQKRDARRRLFRFRF